MWSWVAMIVGYAGRIECIAWILLAWGVLSPFGSLIAQAMVEGSLVSRGVHVSFPMTFDLNALLYRGLAAICRELDCQPGDLLSFAPDR